VIDLIRVVVDMIVPVSNHAVPFALDLELLTDLWVAFGESTIVGLDFDRAILVRQFPS
jgi:hypothetical protein